MLAWDIRDLGYDGHPVFKRLSPGARALLLLMMQSADPATGGSIKRSNASMAAWLGVKDRELRARLRELKDAGLLVVDRPAAQHRPPERRLVNPYRQGGTCVPPSPAQGGTDVPPKPARAAHTCRQGGTPVPPGRHTRAAKVYREVDMRIAGGGAARDAREAGGWPAAPALDMTPTGPNAPPTRRQLGHLADLADELGQPAPNPRMKGEASRMIENLRTEVEARRAHRMSTAREAGRRQGLVDGKHVQSSEASKRAADFIKEEIRGRARR